MLATVTPPSDPDCGAVALEFCEVSVLGEDGRSRLHAVTIAAFSGVVTVVAGPSGAGKSTLLRLGNGLDRPSSGEVRFMGCDITSIDMRDLRRRVGMVFQRPIPFPGTVRNNLGVVDSEAGEEQMLDALDRVGLAASFLDRPADDLSGGECQRMCIARALMTFPEVLLMDEPTTALDPENRFAIERLAATLTDQGLAVIWVSHDLEQVRRIGQQVIVLTEGRLATPEQAADYLRDRSGDTL